MSQARHFYRPASTAVMVLAVAVMLALTATSGAVAARLITGKQIAKNTITAKNLAPKSVGKSELQPGLVGVGPRGPQGPAGPTGPTGSAAADEVYSWDFSYTANGGNGRDERGNPVPVVLSTMTVPANARLQGINLTATGGFTGACDFAGLTVYPYRDGAYMPEAVVGLQSAPGHGPFGGPELYSPLTWTKPQKLAVYAECDVDAPLPTFTGRIVFTVTSLKTAPTTAFN